MNFLFPHILWGLFAILVPVIIHLFNFRKFRKVYFTNVRFLEELKQQTRRQSKLRHLLVMISRMLAIAALVLAFAQPYIPDRGLAVRPDAVNQVSIYIDNSFSMEALSPEGPLLESAKNKAREIALAYRSSDQFMLTVNEFEGSHQRWVSRDEFLNRVDEVTITPAVRTLSTVIDRQNDNYFSDAGQSRRSYIISDFQRSMFDPEEVETDSLMRVSLVPLVASETANLYIDSCWFVSPVHQLAQGVTLVARVVNDSEVNYEKVPLKLTVNNVQKAMASFDISAGTFYDVEMPFTNYEEGIHYGVVEISDYPVVFDDRFYLVFDVSKSIPVLSINGEAESPYLNSLFANDSAFRFTNNPVKNIDFNRLREHQLIILNELDKIPSGLIQELNTFLDGGGSLLIIPSAKAELESYTELLSNAGLNYYLPAIQESTRVAGIDMESPVFADVFEKSPLDRQGQLNTDMPQVSYFFPITSQARSMQMTIMSMLNGKPFLTRETSENGKVYLLAVPLDESGSNFARHALFVPVMYRIALLSAASEPLYYTIGRNDQFDLKDVVLPGDQVVKIASLEDEYEFIPGQQNVNRKLILTLHNQVPRAGHYRLLHNNEPVKGLAFNYNRQESKMRFATSAEISDMLARYNHENISVLMAREKPLSETIRDESQGALLWKLFIILALVFLALEVVLIRFWNSKK